MKNMITNLRLWIVCAVILCTTTTSFAQIDNYKLSLTDVEGAAGKDVSVPISLVNTGAVTALQFDIDLPYPMPKDVAPVMSNRSDGHSVSVRTINGSEYIYRVFVMSYDNKPILGNSGVLMYFPIAVNAEAQAGDTCSIVLNDIVISNATGEQVASETTNSAVFMVQRVPTPDLVVTDFVCGNSVVTPGEAINLTYTVANNGNAPTKGSWTEKVYFVRSDGGRLHVGSTSYDNELVNGASIDRQVAFNLPQVVRVDGNVTVQIELETKTSTTGELIADMANNVATFEGAVNVEKLLFLNSTSYEITEGANKKTKITLTRSGDWSMDETFALSLDVDSVLSFPAEVTIPAKSSGVSFYVYAPDNNVVSENERTHLTISDKMGGYTDLVVPIKVIDDDDYILSITTDKIEYTEGENVAFTVTRVNGSVDAPLEVSLTNDYVSRFTIDRSITIPAGERSATFTLQAKDNSVAQADVHVTETATANEYAMAKVSFRLYDNDRPDITLKLSSEMVSEADGYACMMGTVTRNGDLTHSVSIFIDNNSDGSVFFDSDRVVIPSGKNSVTFPISVADNSTTDGNRVYEVTASVYLPECKCVADDKLVRTTFTVIDDDTEAKLQMQSPSGMIVEGGSANVTVSRNTLNNLSAELVVSLSCNDSMLTLPATVTIPANSTSTSFTVKAAKDAVVGNTHYCNIVAAATGFSGTSIMFTINDATLPDVEVVSLNFPKEITRGSDATIEVTLTNSGLTTLPAGVSIPVMYSYSSYWQNNIEYETLFSFTTDKEIAAGKTITVSSTQRVPWNGRIGTYNFFTWPNFKMDIEEANLFNNCSQFLNNIKINAPYKVIEVTTDRKVYSKGETVVVNGKIEGNLDNENVTVDVYFVNQNTGTKIEKPVSVDINGNFTYALKLDENMGGIYNVGAKYPKNTVYEAFAEIDVYNIGFTKNYIEWEITENVAAEGRIEVTNLSGNAITNVTALWNEIPDGCEVNFGSIAQLQAGATGYIDYRLTATTPSVGKSFTESELTVSCDEGVSASLATYYYCHASQSNIVIDKPTLNTTLRTGSVRNYDVVITNTGLKETGGITLEIPSSSEWLGCTTPVKLPSLAQGESHTLSLQFIYNPEMLVGGTYKSYIKVNSENGPAKIIDVNLTVVATEKGHLTVDVVDVYTKAATDGNRPHVSGATVKIVNAVNGEVAAIGTTGEDGIFAMDLNEGVYNIYATADKHYQSQATVVVGPDENITQEIFLPFAAVNVSYVVEETTVVDEYEVTLEMVIVPDVPQAVVTTNWSNASCGDNTYSVRLTNHGKLVALNPYLVLPNVDGVTMEVLNAYPQKIYPGESYEMKIRVIAPEGMRNKMYSYNIKYAFTIQGETYTHTESYNLNVGCVDMPLFMGGSGFKDYNVGNTTEENQPILPSLSGNGEDDDEGFISTPAYTPLKGAKDSKVVLQFVQTFFLTRQAFRGTMTLQNAQNTGLEDVVLDARVYTMDGNDVTEFFALDYSEKPENMIEGDAGWDIDGGETGKVYVVYVPSKEVAPTEPTQYKFGGTVTYYDVATETEATVQLVPTVLTVNPSPDLHLTYFVQREIKGDNLYTEDVIEPSEPVEFALLIKNEGAGKALDLVIETQEPKIVENKNNLPVKFETLHSSLDGVEGVFPFDKLPVGEIEAGDSKLARWFFESSLSGYVADYNAQLTKSSLYGEEFNLITVDGVRDLTRSINNVSVPMSVVNDMRLKALTPEARMMTLKAGKVSGDMLGDRMNSDIFLLDDIEDAEGLPDYVMLADGTGTEDLEIVSNTSQVVNASGDVKTQYVCTLEVSATRAGWVYGVVQDPTNGTMQLESVVRNDGADMGSNNFWLSSYKTLSDKTVINANELYFADCLPGTSASYTLTFVPKPQEALKVVKVEGVPVAESKEAVTELTVTFNRAIDVTTFTADDMVLMCQSTMADLSSAKITKVSDTQYKVDWSSATPMYGYHTYTLFTSGIKDVDGGVGEKSYTAEWSQAIDGKAMLTIEVTPKGAGEVSPESGEMDYGIVTLKANASEGYSFIGWSEDGNLLTKSAVLNYNLYKPSVLTAQFAANVYDVALLAEDGGIITGAYSGTYEYGTLLTLNAVPYAGYIFDGWLVNGAKYEDSSSSIRLVVTEETTVEPIFILDEPGDATGVDEIETPENADELVDVYSAYGILLKRSVKRSEALDNLPRGFYIVGNKKVLK